MAKSFKHRANLPRDALGKVIAGPGRPKGPRKRTLPITLDLVKMLEANNFNPIIEFINLARDPKCPYATRHKINADLIKLIYPQLKHVEHTGSFENTQLNVTWNIGSEPTPVIEQSKPTDQLIDYTIKESEEDE